MFARFLPDEIWPFTRYETLLAAIYMSAFLLYAVGEFIWILR